METEIATTQQDDTPATYADEYNIDAVAVSQPLAVPLSHPMATMLNESLYSALKRAAGTLAKSHFVPSRFRNCPEDIFVALHMSHRLGADPLLILQNLYIVNGEPGWKTQFVIAQANESGKLSEPIDFDITGTGGDLAVEAFAVLAKTGKRISAKVDMKMATAEGWTSNKKYKSMPDHMLCFRAAAFLVRRYLPEVMLGLQTQDELEGEHSAAPAEVSMLEAVKAATKEAPE